MPKHQMKHLLHCTALHCTKNLHSHPQLHASALRRSSRVGSHVAGGSHVTAASLPLQRLQLDFDRLLQNMLLLREQVWLAAARESQEWLESGLRALGLASQLWGQDQAATSAEWVDPPPPLQLQPSSFARAVCDHLQRVKGAVQGSGGEEESRVVLGAVAKHIGAAVAAALTALTPPPGATHRYNSLCFLVPVVYLLARFVF